MRFIIALMLTVASACGQGFTLKNPFYLATLKAPAAGGSPTEVDQISGLFAWYKPETLLTNELGGTLIGNETNIIAWGDSSGNNRVLTTNNPTAAPPMFNSAGATSKPFGGIEFGSGEYIRSAFTAVADSTIFLVWRINSSGTFLIPLDSTNSSARQVVYKNNGNQFVIYGGTSEVGGGATVSGNWYIQCAVFASGGNDSLYTNNAAISTSLASGSQSLDGLTLGASNSGTLPPGNDSWVGEVVIYNRNLNSTEIGQVFAILNTRWTIY